MPPRHSRGNRDDNEKYFTEYLRRANVNYFLLPEGAGADILVYLQPMPLFEIKNPKVAPSDRKLTEIEKNVMEHCDDYGIPYYVFETVEQMADVLNGYIETATWVRQLREKDAA